MKTEIIKKAAYAIKKVGGPKLLVLKKHAPTAFLALGIVGLVSAGVLACKETQHAECIIENMNEDVADIKARHNEGEGLDEEETRLYRKELRDTYVRGIGKVCRVYLPSVALAGCSIAGIVGSHGMMLHRNNVLMQSIGSITSAFSGYRSLVAEEYGEEVDETFAQGLRIKHGVEVEEIDENTGRKRKKKIDMVEPVGTVSTDGRVFNILFDPTCAAWQPYNPSNKLLLMSIEDTLNRMLFDHGYVFVNDALKLMDRPAGGFLRTT